MKYLDFVKTLTCVVCGTTECIDAHHVIGHGRLSMGRKVDDDYTYPICRKHHDQLHSMGWREWEKVYGSQWEFTARTLSRFIHG
jgi:hypothetical protein